MTLLESQPHVVTNTPAHTPQHAESSAYNSAFPSPLSSSTSNIKVFNEENVEKAISLTHMLLSQYVELIKKNEAFEAKDATNISQLDDIIKKRVRFSYFKCSSIFKANVISIRNSINMALFTSKKIRFLRKKCQSLAESSVRERGLKYLAIVDELGKAQRLEALTPVIDELHTLMVCEKKGDSSQQPE